MHWSSIVAIFIASLQATLALKFPTNDPFYDPPKTLAKHKPGDVLRSRQVKSAFPRSAKVARTYQYLYRTTDSLGHAAAAVTTLLIPKGSDRTKMFTYLFAYDACFINCSPSYFLQQGAKKNMSDDGEFDFIESALARGYYVNSPDYESNDAQYTAGVISGQATLDSVRAVLNSAKRNRLSPKARYVMLGYSGGSIAGEYAAELQPKYAPELHFAGAALGGLTPNVTSVLLTVNNQAASGLVPPAMLGLGKAYPKLGAYIRRNLKPSRKQEFLDALHLCFDQTSAMYTVQDIFSYFKNGRQILHDPIPRQATLAGGIMGVHGVPKMPLHFYKAVHDEVSPIEDTNKLFRKLCAKGSRIQYQKNTAGSHAEDAAAGFPAAFQFLVNRLEGKKVEPGCSTKVVTINA